MTDDTPRRRTLSFPPDVAARLEHEPNASAYVTEVVRARMRADQVAAELAAAGIATTEEGIARARARRLAIDAEWPRERCAAVRRRVHDIMEAELPASDATRAPAA